MKVEIDLNEILGDENGVETIQQSVRRQVVESLRRKIEDGVGKQISAEVARILDEEIRSAVKGQMPQIVNDLINTEYVMVDRYGSNLGKTTFRSQLTKAITDNCQYKKERYDSDKNVFTKVVDDCIDQNFKQMRDEFNNLYTKKFQDEALAYAATRMKELLGIKV